jgi:hypothetical protein
MAIADNIRTALQGGFSIDEIEKELGNPGVVGRIKSALDQGFSASEIDQLLSSSTDREAISYGSAPNIQAFQAADISAPKPPPVTPFEVDYKPQYTEQNYVLGTQPEVTPIEEKIGQSINRYGQNAVTNWNNLVQAGKMASDPAQANSDINYGIAPQIVAQAERQFLNETVKPLIYPAAMLGLPYAAAIAAPLFLSDVTSSLREKAREEIGKGGTIAGAFKESVLGTLADFTPFLRMGQEISKDPQAWWQKAQDMPGETIYEFGMNALATYMIGKGFVPRRNAKGELPTMAEIIEQAKQDKAIWTAEDQILADALGNKKHMANPTAPEMQSALATVLQKIAQQKWDTAETIANSNKMAKQGDTIVWETKDGKRIAGEVLGVDREGNFDVKGLIWDERGQFTPYADMNGQPWITYIKPNEVVKVISKDAPNLVPDLTTGIKEGQYAGLFKRAEKGETDLVTREVLPGESIYTPDPYAALPPIRTAEQIKADTRYGDLFDRASKGETDVRTLEGTTYPEYVKWWMENAERTPAQIEAWKKSEPTQLYGGFSGIEKIAQRFMRGVAPAQYPDAVRKVAQAVSEKEPPTIMEKAKQVYGGLAEKWLDPLAPARKQLNDVIFAETGKPPSIEKDIPSQMHIAKYKGAQEANMLLFGRDPNLKFMDADSGKAIQAIENNRPGVTLYKTTMADVLNLLKDRKDKALLDYYSIAKQFQAAVLEHPDMKVVEVDGKPLTFDDAAIAQKYIEQNHPNVVEAHTKMMEVARNNMELNVADGLVSRQLADMLQEKYPDHVPFYRNMDAMNDAHFGKQGGYFNIPETIKGYTGSTRQILSPVESVMMNVIRDRARGNKNVVAQNLVDLAAEHPWVAEMEGVKMVDGEPVQMAGKYSAGKDRKSFTVWVDGEKYSFSTTPEIYNAIQSMTPSAQSVFAKILGPGKQLLQATATGINPEFMIKNQLRDPLYAAITSDRFNPVVDPVKGLKQTLESNQSLYDYLAGGGGMEGMLTSERTELTSRVRDAIEKRGAGKYMRDLMDVLSMASNISEMSTRIGAYSRTLAETGNVAEAVKAGRNASVDFGVMGTWAKELNQVIPFFNAAIQGNKKIVDYAKQNPKAFTAKGLAAITVPTILLELAFGDDKRIKDAPDVMKHTNFLIPAGDSYIAIPKPPGLGFLFATIPQLMIDSMRKNDPQFAKLFEAARKEYAPPIGMPGVQQMVEWFANYNFFRERAIVSQKYSKLPDSAQYNRGTSEIAKDIGKMFNVSPLKVDNTIQGLTAGTGRIISDAYNLIRSDANAPAKPWQQTPIIRSIVKSPLGATQSQEDFYDRLDALTKIKEGAKIGQRKPTTDENNEYNRIYGASIILREMKKAENNIAESKKLTPAEKRIKLDEIERKQQEIILKALKR